MLAMLNFASMLAGIGVALLALYAAALARGVRYVVPVGHPLTGVVLGLSLAAISFLGVMASLSPTPRRAVVRMYMGTMTVLLVGQLFVSVMVLAARARLPFMLDDAWERASKRDYPLIERLERAYRCCGFGGPNDRAVPKDCGSSDSAFGFQLGCQVPLQRHLREAMTTVGRTGLRLSLILALSLLLTVAVYAEQMSTSTTASAHGDWWEEDSQRLEEARRLLRQGDLPPTQSAR